MYSARSKVCSFGYRTVILPAKSHCRGSFDGLFIFGILERSDGPSGVRFFIQMKIKERNIKKGAITSSSLGSRL